MAVCEVTERVPGQSWLSPSADFLARSWIAWGTLVVAIVDPTVRRIDHLLTDAILLELGGGAWPIPDQPGALLKALYLYPKIGLVLLSLALAAALILTLVRPEAASRLERRGGLRLRPAPIIGALLCLGLTVGLVALLKSATHVYCPLQLDSYGGAFEEVSVLTGWRDGAPAARCWPAAHASGGFGLIGLVLLARTPATRLRLIAFSFLLGALLGAYQMLAGRHFLSHTVASAAIAWIVLCAIQSTTPTAIRLARRLSASWQSRPSRYHRAPDIGQGRDA